MKKHIVCLGDSNTHGYCADPADCADGGSRFNETERWTRVLETLLGPEYLVLEEGLGGRTTAFEDSQQPFMPAMPVLYSVLMSHEPVELLIVMLGTNDVKDRIGADLSDIGEAMSRLIRTAKEMPCWAGEPRILVICPPHIPQEMDNPDIGPGSIPKSRALAGVLEPIARSHGCAFLNAQGIASFNMVDHLHLTRSSHAALAKTLAGLVPELMRTLPGKEAAL